MCRRTHIRIGLNSPEPLSAYWQVRSTTDYATYTYADGGVWWSFTKVSGVSGKFSPENGTSDHSSSVWLNWSAVDDAGYWVCWDTTDNGTCDTSWVANGGSTSKLVSSLSPGTYYWQVRVQTGDDYVDANGGTWWRFTVGADTSEPGSGTATVTREYIYLGSMLLASIESGSTLTYYHTDALGSVRAITNASGSTLSRIDYAAFGENGASLSGNPRKFIGGEQDAETAFDYLGARYYRNVWGRFTSPDPVMSGAALTNPQLWNRYTYGLNSPLRFGDPSGMSPEDRDPYQMEDYKGLLEVEPDLDPRLIKGLAFIHDSPSAIQIPRAGGFNEDPPQLPVILPGFNPGMTRAIVDAISFVQERVCSWGFFAYGESYVGIPFTPIKFESVAVLAYDSVDGGMHGGYAGLSFGITPQFSATAGIEGLRTWRDWESHWGPIYTYDHDITFSSASKAFGRPIQTGESGVGGFVNRLGDDISIGAYVGGRIFGAGPYISFNRGGCTNR